jgi:hypothetical protein
MIEAVKEKHAVWEAGQGIVRRISPQLVAFGARVVHDHREAYENRETARAVPGQNEAQVRRTADNIGAE